jgi:hypothetical protein
VYEPTRVDEAVVRIIVDIWPGRTVAGLKVAVAPAGRSVARNESDREERLRAVVPIRILEITDRPCATETLDGVERIEILALACEPALWRGAARAPPERASPVTVAATAMQPTFVRIR